MSATPSGPSIVLMFQVKATRSRQKQSSRKQLGGRRGVLARQRVLEALQPAVDLGGGGLHGGL